MKKTLLIWACMTAGIVPSEKESLQTILDGQPFDLYAKCAVARADAAARKNGYSGYDKVAYLKFLKGIYDPKSMRRFVEKRLMKEFKPQYIEEAVGMQELKISRRIQASQVSFLKKCAEDGELKYVELSPNREKLCTDVYLNIGIDLFSIETIKMAEIDIQIAALRLYSPLQKKTPDLTLRRYVESFDRKSIQALEAVRERRQLQKPIAAEFCGQHAQLSHSEMKQVLALSQKQWYRYFTKHLSLGVAEAINSRTKQYVRQH